jgi:hypothetical protein
VKDEELQLVYGLKQSYDEFSDFIHDADKSNLAMKRDLEIQMDSYGNQMTELRSQSQFDLPRCI